MIGSGITVEYVGGPANGRIEQHGMLNGDTLCVSFVGDNPTVEVVSETAPVSPYVPIYVAEYRAGKRLGPNHFQYDFWRFTPTATKALRAEIRRELHGEMFATYTTKVRELEDEVAALRQEKMNILSDLEVVLSDYLEKEDA